MQRLPVGVLLISLWTLATLFWWGLAFFPTIGPTPEWLLVARQVCFGSVSDGLPDASGWMLLILGPVSFLVVGLVIWSAEIKKGLAQISEARMGRLAVALVALAFVVEGAWVGNKLAYGLKVRNYSFENQSLENLPESYPKISIPADDFSLIDQSGARVGLADFTNETVVLTFAFAHCQTVCPVLVRQAIETAEATKTRLRVLVITLDPWRDTPKSLPDLAEKWELPENAHILSGPVEEVLAVLDSFKVPYQRDEKTGDVTHPALIYVIPPGGKLAFLFNDAPSQWIQQAIERIHYGNLASEPRPVL